MRENENSYFITPSYSAWLDDLFAYPLRNHGDLNRFPKLFWNVRLRRPPYRRNGHLGQEKIMTWQEDMRTALKSAEDLKHFFDCEISTTPYSIFIPRTFAEKIKKGGYKSPLWKQFIPQKEENSPEGLLDPIGDKIYLKAPQIIHRYKNRALFLPTTICPVICRYCFRKNELSFSQDLFLPKFNETLDYLRNNPQIEELIFSGGDPLILSDEKLSYYLCEFEKIPSLKFIRLHTRTPIILPSRITDNLIAVLKNNSFKKVTVAIHVNHSDELDTEVREAILKMKGLNLLSQTVLLKGVNDDSKILKELIQNLISLNIRPYYLHHPDKVKGGMNYYLEIEEGRKIYQTLRDEIPGWAIFNYVVDVPGGKGKSPAFNPESFVFSGNLMGKDGNLYPY